MILTDQDRDVMRREDHDSLIRMETCLKIMQKELHEQGTQIKDLYERLHPISQWIGTANSGFKVFSYLGVVVVIVSLLWNGVATGISMLPRLVSEPQAQHITVDKKELERGGLFIDDYGD